MTTIYSQLRTDLTSDQYHGMAGTYSSSQLKTMLEDPEKFYKDYITKENPRKESSAFDIGTYFHTAVLEPHLLDDECAVYTGAIRRGKEWDAFKAEHAGKAIITSTEHEGAVKMIEAVKASPVAMSFLDGFDREVSAFADLLVLGDEIFSSIGEELHSLSPNGWIKREDMSLADVLEFAVVLRIKVRADAINFNTGVISDLKSTTGNCKNEHQVKTKIDSYSYDLSTSLYLDIFSAASTRPFTKFAWIFASKDFGNCKTWLASENNIKIGRAKWKKAVIELAYYINNEWKFEDSLGILEPSFFQHEWLKEGK